MLTDFKHYEVLNSLTLGDLAKIVNEHLEAGWKLSGSTFTYPNNAYPTMPGVSKVVFAQAIVKD